MENVSVSIRFGAYCISPNDKEELVFESGGSTKTAIPAEEINKKMMEAQSLEEILTYLKDSGAYIGSEDSRVMIVENPGGTQIFFKDEPGRKITLDKELPNHVAEEILNIDNYDDNRAVDKILEANNIIEKETEELDIVASKDDISMEVNNADNVLDNDITENGVISQSRQARDEREMTGDRMPDDREVLERRRDKNRNEGLDR